MEYCCSLEKSVEPLLALNLVESGNGQEFRLVQFFGAKRPKCASYGPVEGQIVSSGDITGFRIVAGDNGDSIAGVERQDVNFGPQHAADSFLPAGFFEQPVAQKVDPVDLD